ncbi:MAG: GNAT family N-acetyltransferase [Chlorobiales bacterium]|jgi:hypothetical protein|nr:GNAT family N-acetyltransferase [Chlorobiales bacterium]
MGIEIREAVTKKEVKQYIKFAWKVYRNDPELNKYWVPPVIFDYVKTLDKVAYPLWEHADRALFTAWRNGEMVGTITAITNSSHNKIHNDKVGFWGFFECINDQEVANTLFDTAKKWLKQRGMNAMRGPISPSMNDQCGMLTKGFDSPPVFLMLYNPPYYNDLCKKYGHHVGQELVAWHINQDIIDKVRLKRISDLVKKREKVTIRDINMKDFQNEVKRIKTLYNEAWEMNWGFVPMTDKEFDALADGLKQVVDPELVYIVENQEGKPIGFSLSLPDMNIPLKHVNGNPLTPWGLVKFLWYKREIKMLRTITMGVIPSYRNKGIDSVMNSEIVERAKQKGIYGSEMSWVLKCNEAMSKLATAIGGDPYKEYAIYEIDI